MAMAIKVSWGQLTELCVNLLVTNVLNHVTPTHNTSIPPKIALPLHRQMKGMRLIKQTKLVQNSRTLRPKTYRSTPVQISFLPLLQNRKLNACSLQRKSRQKTRWPSANNKNFEARHYAYKETKQNETIESGLMLVLYEQTRRVPLFQNQRPGKAIRLPRLRLCTEYYIEIVLIGCT
jgi:hypothetical protein